MLWNALMERTPVNRSALTHQEPIDVHAAMVSHSIEMDLPVVVSITACDINLASFSESS